VMVFSVPFGYIADRWRRTRIISWGTAAWGATMIFTGTSWNYGSLLAGRMALGAWDPCDNPTSQSLLADYYPTVQRSKVMSVYQVGQLLGIFLVPIAAAMAATWGWRSAFYFLAIPAFVVAILARRLPEPVRGQQDRAQLGLDATTKQTSVYDTMPWRPAYREILRCRTFVLATLSSGVGSLFFGSVGTWSPTFFIRYHDMTLAQAAGALSLLALGGLAGALLSGWIADYLTYRGLLAGRVVVGAVARLIALPLFILTFTIANTPIMLVMFTLAAACLIAPQAPLNAARADVLHPRLRGRGTALDIVVQSSCAAVAPVLVGVLADTYNLRTAFLIVAPLMGLSGLILLLATATYVREERRLRRIIRAETTGVEVDEIPDASDPMGPMEGESPAAASLRLARTSPSVHEGGDLLVIDGLDVAYGPIQVLFGASLRVRDGGVHALVGRNGVGKTTLLCAIAGLLDWRAGRIVYDGLDLTGVPPEQRVKLGITLMSGGRSTFPSMSVEENIWIGAYPFHADHALVGERFDAVLDIFPMLQSRLGQSGGTLSGGEQQMVALARALVAGPRLLLLDELSIGLAPMVTRELLSVVGRIRDLGTTVVLVEQSVPHALAVADTVMFMEKGRVTNLGDAALMGDGSSLVHMMMAGRPPVGEQRIVSDPFSRVTGERSEAADRTDTDHAPPAIHDADDNDAEHDRWRRPFYAFVAVGIALASILGIHQVIDKPIVDLSDVRSTWEDGTVPRAQALARNNSTSTTYCIEVTFEAVDTDGLSLESVVGLPTTGATSLRPGQSTNFAASFEHLTETEIREELDDVLAFVTGRRTC
jgi:ABC-type branched-subunit amino acid transport system ATPase component/sugar phosphate permease